MRSVARFAAITILILAAAYVGSGPAWAELIPVSGSTGVRGITLRTQDATGVSLHFEMGSYELAPVDVNGQTMQQVLLPGVLLPNDAGAPDLPGMGRMLAIPNGATATVRILSARTETRTDVDVAPAPVIPKETHVGPLVYEKNPALFNRDAFYPESPVVLSEPGQIRGSDIVTLGITPFQYNPMTKELVIYTELDVAVDFHGGNGHFGIDRLRSRFWEPILAQSLINYSSLPDLDFSLHRDSRDGVEYIIICPDDPVFIAWADTLKNWRQLQGISTDVFTTTEIGGTTPTVIENWLNNAYNTWDPAPVAFLILGDYPNSGFRDSGVTSPIWNSYCVSDNIFADVNGDNLPDMVHGRITARNDAELDIMIHKQLDFERNPPTYAPYYDHPLIAGGWQTERWFILCCEVIYGHQANALGKHPIREYAIYSGTPGTVWSTATNTSTVVNYFGPSGLNYIPSTPQHLTDWGGNATRINADLNDGCYFLLHRDHGMETGWGEPSYTNGSLSGLHNDLLPFVMSMNCLTGKYNYSGECFTEAFHRMAQGALGVIAASEISYSFVNDTLVWGLFDVMWPGFMPDYGPFPPASRFSGELRPAFGMAGGKHFLYSSSWPYNTGDKLVTYHLFHNHGDPFLAIYSEIPQNLTVTHDPVLFLGVDTFQMQADAGALIGLTVDGEIIASTQATGMPQEILITPQAQPGTMRLTVTKANYYRYVADVPVLPPTGPYLVLDHTELLDPEGDDDGQADAGETFDLNVTLKNVGVEATSDVSATVTSADEYAQILVGERSFPDIPPGAMGTCLEPYSLHVMGNVPDGHVIAYTVDSQSAEGAWQSSFALVAQAPVLAATQHMVDDAPPGGNGNGTPDPGETVYLQFWLDNTGHSNCGLVTGTLSTINPDVVILDGEGECLGVPMGGQGLLAAFQVEFLPGCPSPGTVTFHLSLSGSDGFAVEQDYLVDVGPWFDNAEGDRGWTLGGPGDTAISGQWIRDDPVGTLYNGQQCQPEDDHTVDPGHICFVTGNGTPGGTAGENDVDGGKTTLLSPVFALGNATAASISYWRWYTNNLGNSPSQDYWDVDVTEDGANWVHLEHTTDSANSWNEYTFDLTEFVALTDQTQIRFVAADESPGSLVEAAVDDFTLTAVLPPASDVPVEEVVAHNGIVSCSPNPLHRSARIVYQVAQRGHAKLTLYDVSGRALRSLVDGPIEAGTHTVEIDARDGSGHSLPSGIYFLRLETPGMFQVKQVALVK